MHDPADCPCDVCALERQGIPEDQAQRQVALMSASLIAQHGWTSHVVIANPVSSIHTHGLSENARHPDLEIMLPLAPQGLYRLLEPLAEAVKAGKTFYVDQEDRTLFNVPVRFRTARESGREVLRAVFPDPSGRWPEDPLVETGWNLQLTGL